MKNNMKLLTVALLASTLFISCNKKDDDSGTNNYLIIDSKEYGLSAGFLGNYGTDNENSLHYGYNTDLLLYSEGLSIQLKENDEWYLVGNGHGIYFEMFSATGNYLDNEDYVFNSTEPHPIGTFDYGHYVINYDTENGYSGDEDDVVSGKVSVYKNGSEYNITIDCASTNGKKITGFYKGTLRYFDWSGEN